MTEAATDAKKIEVFDRATLLLTLRLTFEAVFQQIADVRQGKLTPDEAAERDDAAVRAMARVLMGENDAVTTELPYVGGALVEKLRAAEPQLFEGVESDNPRALMVGVCRRFMKEIARARESASERRRKEGTGPGARRPLGAPLHRFDRQLRGEASWLDADPDAPPIAGAPADTTTARRPNAVPTCSRSKWSRDFSGRRAAI